MTRLIIPILSVMLIMFLIDLYAYQALKAGISTQNNWPKYIYWGFSLVPLLSVLSILFIPIPLWPDTFKTYLFAFIILLYLSKFFMIFFLFIEDISRFFRWIANILGAEKDETPFPRRTALMGRLSLVVGILPVLSGLYGMIKNAYNYKIHRVKVPLSNLPKAFEGFKIVQLSDIHSGSFTAKRPILKAIEMINKEQADIVLFTGDMVNNRSDEFIPYLEIFDQIKAKEGIFSSLGNHDYGDYYRWKSEHEKQENMRLLEDLQSQMGWQLLRNENRVINRNGEKIAVLGVENWSAKRFGKRGRVDLALKGVEDVPVKLLMSHDPSHWDAEIRPKYPEIDITFSGHTHGAQFGIEWGPIRWSPSQYIYKQWAGLYQKGKQYLYVNRGFGFLGYPGRIGILPEITVMELHKS